MCNNNIRIFDSKSDEEFVPGNHMKMKMVQNKVMKLLIMKVIYKSRVTKKK